MKQSRSQRIWTETQILKNSSNLGLDITERQICPNCKSTEKSLSVTKTRAGVLYHCFRASCGLGGFISALSPVPEPYNREPKKTPHKVFKEALRDMTKEELWYIMDRFQIPENDILEAGWLFCPSWNRYYWPILGPNGRELGCTLRSYELEPKAFSFHTDNAMELMDWKIVDFDRNFVFLVEDQCSALKIRSLGFNAIALVGTNLNANRVKEIGTYFDSCCLMLDGDAFRTAIKHVQRYHIFFKKLFAVNPGQDPKNWPRDELRTFLQEIK
jgi:hypothetical protein